MKNYALGARLFLFVALLAAAAVAETVIGPYKSLSEAPDVLAEFEVIPKQSTIRYYGVANAHEFSGVSGAVGGSIAGNPRDIPGTAHVKIIAQIATFDSGEPRRDKNMREATDVKKFPEVVFVSDEVKAVNQSQVPDYRLQVFVAGPLVFHGVSKRIKLPVDLAFDNKKLTMSAKGEFRVRMSEFGIKIPTFLVLLTVEDEFKIEFNIVARLVKPLPE